MRFRDTAVLADRATGNASLLAISRHEPTLGRTMRAHILSALDWHMRGARLWRTGFGVVA
jgi:hypothetical protein